MAFQCYIPGNPDAQSVYFCHEDFPKEIYNVYLALEFLKNEMQSITASVGINDDAISTLSTWSSSKINESFVKVEQGKGLSTNDFTNEYKQKLDSLNDTKTLVVINKAVTLDDTQTQNLTIHEDVTINLPTNLEFKRIILNLVSISENPVIITFTQNTENKRIKIAANSYNVFEIDLNRNNSIIRKFSDINAELTETEVNEGILN